MPLVLAETYSLLDALLFGVTVWRLKSAARRRRRRRARPSTSSSPPTTSRSTWCWPPPGPPGTSPTRTGPGSSTTAPATRCGPRPSELGVGYITRSDDWTDRPRHAKAGNLNNALFATEGEFLLILDADQVPDPTSSTARSASSATTGSPWCRRRSGSPTSPTPTRSAARRRCSTGRSSRARTAGTPPSSAAPTPCCAARRSCSSAWSATSGRPQGRCAAPCGRPTTCCARPAGRPGASDGPAVVAALDEVGAAVREARAELAAGEPVSEVTYRVPAAGRRRQRRRGQRRRRGAARRPRGDPRPAASRPTASCASPSSTRPRSTSSPAARGRPLGALESVQALVRSVDVDRDDEAQPVMPLATISVTEDMATSMRLHGWAGRASTTTRSWPTAWRPRTSARCSSSGCGGPRARSRCCCARTRWCSGACRGASG